MWLQVVSSVLQTKYQFAAKLGEVAFVSILGIGDNYVLYFSLPFLGKRVSDNIVSQVSGGLVSHFAELLPLGSKNTTKHNCNRNCHMLVHLKKDVSSQVRLIWPNFPKWTNLMCLNSIKLIEWCGICRVIISHDMILVCNILNIIIVLDGNSG